MATAPETKPTPKTTRSKLPVGIHKSWFEKPHSIRYTAWCDSNGCECGPFQKAFDAGTALAVADALYLDGAWHRYDGYQRELAAEKHDASKKIALTAAIDEAVCDILMAQAVLKKYSRKTIKELKSLKLEAEARGFDTPDACASDDFVACDYYSKAELYDRMGQDIKALKYPRDSFTALLEKLTTR